MSTLLIQGGRVVSPEDGLDGALDVWIEDGKIRAVAPGVTASVGEIFDARGLVVCPGLVDMHVHLREPGGEESETLETGLSAAIAGGFTAVCPMPNTRPVNDHAELTQAMIAKARSCGLAHVHPIAAVSLRSEGEILTDFAALLGMGAVAFSDDGRPVKTAGLMKRALEEAAKLGVPVIDHCEDLSVTAGGVINAGEVARRLGLKGAAGVSEDVCVARDLVLAGATGAHVHLAHLSTACAVEMVRAAKRRGVRVTCEVTPHHFTLTEEEVERQGANAKMNPPLRRAQDRDAIIEGLADGTIDVIATDHAPHAAALKAGPIDDVAFGVTGLETALALGITQLVKPGRIPLPRLVELLSSRPARIIGQPHGRLRAGGAADITVFDPRREWTYRVTEGKSKSRNSPFDGWKLRGAVSATLVGGKIVYRTS
ncbi:MAG: dihydroorotase [Terriglobia bacterium]